MLTLTSDFIFFLIECAMGVAGSGALKELKSWWAWSSCVGMAFPGYVTQPNGKGYLEMTWYFKYI